MNKFVVQRHDYLGPVRGYYSVRTNPPFRESSPGPSAPRGVCLRLPYFQLRKSFWIDRTLVDASSRAVYKFRIANRDASASQATRFSLSISSRADTSSSTRLAYRYTTSP